MDVMTILVLEETEADLGHHQRILETIPGVRLGLFADPAAASKIYVDQKIDVLVVDDGILDGGLAFLKQVHVLSGRRDVPVVLHVPSQIDRRHRAVPKLAPDHVAISERSADAINRTAGRVGHQSR